MAALKHLAIIGLDGESWSEIDRYRQLYLPDNLLLLMADRLLKKAMRHCNRTFNSIFQGLRQKFNCETLLCDSEVIHTVPAWILAFSGIPLSKHGMACYHKLDESLWRKSDFKYPFLWNILEQQGFSCKVLTFKCFLLNHRIKVQVGDDILRPTCYKESLNNIEWATRKVMQQLIDAPNFFLYTSPFPDNAQHLRSARKITENQYVKIRQKQDGFLRSIFPLLLKHDFIIMSDHGHPFLLNYKFEWNGLQDSQHHPEGIIITNLPDPPTKLSQVFTYIMDYFEVEI